MLHVPYLPRFPTRITQNCPNRAVVHVCTVAGPVIVCSCPASLRASVITSKAAGEDHFKPAKRTATRTWSCSTASVAAAASPPGSNTSAAQTRPKWCGFIPALTPHDPPGIRGTPFPDAAYPPKCPRKSEPYSDPPSAPKSTRLVGVHSRWAWWLLGQRLFRGSSSRGRKRAGGKPSIATCTGSLL